MLYGAATVLGLLATWVFLRSPLMGQQVHVGPWRTSLVNGSADADLYTRAKVAPIALLALSRDETLYFIADHDDAGRPLRSACSYRVEGLPPPARWWSVTAYAEDYFLFADEGHRYSVNGAHAPLDARGRFAFVTGPSAPAGGTPWLPTPGDRGLVLTLRLYNPQGSLGGDPTRLAAPSVQAVGACS